MKRNVLVLVRRSVVAVLCVVLAAGLLSGCQLAREGLGSNPNDDMIIGVLVMVETAEQRVAREALEEEQCEREEAELDAASENHSVVGEIEFGEEEGSYHSYGPFTNLFYLITGRSIVSPKRVYATAKPKTIIVDEETNKKIEGKEYVFENIEGYAAFCPLFFDKKGDVVHSDFIYDDEIAEISFGAGNHPDGGSRIEIEGTVYVASSSEGLYYNTSPIFQTPDGYVYAVLEVTEQGSTFIGSVGGGVSNLLEVTSKRMRGGKTLVDTASISVGVELMRAPQKIVVYEMDSRSVFLSETEYEPNKVPKTFEAQAETAYLVVETYEQGKLGSTILKRETYDRGAEDFTSYYAREDGICMRQSTDIVWK